MNEAISGRCTLNGRLKSATKWAGLKSASTYPEAELTLSSLLNSLFFSDPAERSLSSMIVASAPELRHSSYRPSDDKRHEQEKVEREREKIEKQKD